MEQDSSSVGGVTHSEMHGQPEKVFVMHVIHVSGGDSAVLAYHLTPQGKRFQWLKDNLPALMFKNSLDAGTGNKKKNAK